MMQGPPGMVVQPQHRGEDSQYGEQDMVSLT